MEKYPYKYLHAIGNLTLSGYNQELSNKSYIEKRGELIKSNLELNRYFQKIHKWDEEEIIKRGNKLAERIAKIWPCLKSINSKLYCNE